MSRWTATRLALAGLLASTINAPTYADDADVAPMPRPVAKSFGFSPLFKIEIEFKFSSDDSDAGRSSTKTRTFLPCTPVPPCCAFDCPTTLAVAPMPRSAIGQGFRGNIGTLSTTPLKLDFATGLNDHRQLLNISVGVFGEQESLPVAPMPHRKVDLRFIAGYEEDPRLDTSENNHVELLKLSAEVFETEDSFPMSPMPPSPAVQRCEGVMQQPSASAASQPDMRIMYPLVGVTAVRRDKSGTWWAEVQGVPQPKQTLPTVCLLPPDATSLVPTTAPTAGPLLIPQQTCRPAKPANVPAGEFDVMAGVLGTMLDAKPACPVPCPVQPAGYSVPLNIPVLALPPSALPQAARAGITGTWVREIGPIMYVVKVAPDHVTITATSSVELPEGKTYTEGIVMTADYHLTRDGTTIVGLITSVDAIIEGAMPADMDLPGNGDELSRIQKLLVDKPLAMNVRLYGDVMAVGNVRLPELEVSRGACYPLTMLGGRYTHHGDKSVPKPKAVKLQVPRDMLPVPLTSTPSSYIPAPPPPIQQTGGTLPPLPLNVPNDLPPMTAPRTLPPGLGQAPPAVNRSNILGGGVGVYSSQYYRRW